MEEFFRDNILSLLILGIQGVWGWFWWSLRKQFISIEQHAACQQKNNARIGKVETDISTLAQQVKELPTVQGTNALMLEIEKVRGVLTGLQASAEAQQGAMKGLASQIQLLVENELRSRHG